MAIVGTRPLTPEDEPLLWEMLQLAIYMPDGSVAPKSMLEKPEIRRYVEGWGQPHDRGFAAVVRGSGNAVGAAWTRLFTGENRGYGYIDDLPPELTIAIREDWRDQGVGSFMLRELFDSLRDQYPGVSLSVSTANPALHLYERLGFKLVGQTGTPGSSVTMLRIWVPVADKEKV